MTFLSQPEPGLRPRFHSDATLLAIGSAGAVLMAVAPLPLAVLGAGVYAIAVGVRPWVIVPTLILTLPFHLHPRTFSGLEISATELAILVGTLAILTASLTRRAATWFPDRPFGAASLPTPHAPLEIVPHPIDWAVALFLLAALLSLLVTEYPKQSLREARWLIVEPIAVFYLARATLRSDHVPVVLWSLVGAGTLAAMVGLASVVGSGELLSTRARATEPYLSPNHLGLFLGRTISVALALLLFAPHDGHLANSLSGSSRSLAFVPRGGSRASILTVGGLVVMGLALLRTLSIGAWFGVWAAALLLAGLRGRRWVLTVVAALIVVALAAPVVLPPERTISRFDPSTGTGLFRLEIWTAAAHMVADHPILGIGLDNFLYAYRGGYMLPEAWEEPNISHPHNLVLHFWLQLGLLGLAVALGLILTTAVLARRQFRAGKTWSQRVAGAAVLAMLVDFVVHGSFDNSYFLVDAAIVWWLGIALLLVNSQGSNPAARSTTAGPDETQISARAMG